MRRRLSRPLRFVDDDAGRHADMARAVVIEYLAGDLTVDQLETELDWYLRGIAPPPPPKPGDAARSARPPR